MTDVRGAGRARPRGAAKIKLHGSTSAQSSNKQPVNKTSSPRGTTVLPKLKSTIGSGSNNNHHDQHQAPAAPFSPRVREIPVVLPVAPHPPRPVVPALRPVPPSLLGESDLLAGPSLSKAAWSTPRSPVPETSEPPSASTSSSALDTFFHADADGAPVRTPARLLSVEETLLTTQQLYHIDWAKLQADTDKFFEISATASQHLDVIQADLPLVASTSEQTRAALLDLAKDIATLHDHNDAEKEELLARFERVLAQRNEEQDRLLITQAVEQRAMEESHEKEMETLKADFRRQILEIEERSAGMEANSRQEIESLKQTMANELQRQQGQSQNEREQLERRFQNEFDELRARSDAAMIELRDSSKASYQQLLNSSQEEIRDLKSSTARELSELKNASDRELSELKSSSHREISELKSSSAREISELKSSSAKEINELKSSSAREIDELKSSSAKEISELETSSAKEIERLMSVSESSLAEITKKLSSELAESREQASRTISALKEDHATRIAQLQCDAAEELEGLKQRYEDERQRLEDERDRQVNSLQHDLQSATKAHTSHVEKLTARHHAELSATTTRLTAENEILVQHHAQQVSALRDNHTEQVSTLCDSHTNEMSRTVASYETQLATLKQQHEGEVTALKNKALSTHEALVQQYESQLSSMQDEAARERDRLVLRYESDLDFLRRSTAEQIETITTERADAIQQLREAHAARVLALETIMREKDKRQSETVAQLEEEMEEKKARIIELEHIDEALRLQNMLQTERANEETGRLSMRLEEVQAAVVQLEQHITARDGTIESLTRELRVSEDGNHTKSNTVLELTFVIKSRDDEIQKLHAALLDTIQNVNSKTEILELTAETLSSKTKELEDTRAALRLESGRLSRIEEDVHVKKGMLEDSELKIENMRLQSETLRLEMKRLQMDMRLQHEHSAGEMELKQGEIRRLHAAQQELKLKNDIHQETIVRLEGSLVAAQRQGDEWRRQMELLKLETAQHLEESRRLCDAVLEKDKQITVVTKDAQTFHNDKLTLQIRLNNSLTHIQIQREHLERSAMLVEDLHGQYQRRMEMTAAERDARLRQEKHILLLELSTLKDALRRYEDIDSQLQASHATNALLRVQIGEAVEEKVQLAVQIQALEKEVERLEAEEILMAGRTKALEEDVARVESEKVSTAAEHTQQLQHMEMQLDERIQRMVRLESMLDEARQELQSRDTLVASMSSDTSSLHQSLQERDDILVAIQQRLDGALEEKIRASQEIGSLQDQVLKIEQLGREKDEEISSLEKAFQSESETHLRDVKELEDQLLEMETQHTKAMRELEAVLAKEQTEKEIQVQALVEANLQLQHLATALKAAEDVSAALTIQVAEAQSANALQGRANEEANLQLQYVVTKLKAAEDAFAVQKRQMEKTQSELARQVQAHEDANSQIQYLVSALKAVDDRLALVQKEKAIQSQAHEEANSQIQYLMATLKDIEDHLEMVRSEKAIQALAHEEVNSQVQYLVSTLKTMEERLEVAQSEKAIQDKAHEEANSQIQVLVSTLKAVEDQLETVQGAKMVQEQAHEEANVQIQYLVSALKALDESLEMVRSEKAVQGQAHEEAKFQIDYLVSTLKGVEGRLEMVQNEKAVQCQAYAEANFQMECLVSTLKGVEGRLEMVQNEKAVQGQAHAEANFQIQYLVASLKQQEEALTKQLHLACASIQEKERQADERVAMVKAEAVQVHEMEVEALKRELDTLATTLTTQLQQLEESKRQELHQQREGLTTASRDSMARAQEAFSEEMAVIRAEHARMIGEAEAKLEDWESRLATAVTRGEQTENKLKDSREQCQALTLRVDELERQVVETERSLAETQELLRVRKATIDSVRKEMALMIEIHKQAIETIAITSEDGASRPMNGRSMDQALQLLKNQLETFVNEDFHVELPDVKLEAEEDLVAHLKEAMRMRYCLSMIGSPCVLSGEDVCGSLRTLQQIARVAIGVSELSTTTLPNIEDSVKTCFRDHTALVQQLRGLLDVDRTAVIAEALQDFAPVFLLLKELSALEDGVPSRVAALLAMVADFKALKLSTDSLLSLSRATLHVDFIRTLADLLPVINEAALVRRVIHAHRDGTFGCAEEEEEPRKPATNLLLTSELQQLLSERHLLLAELATTLEWQRPSASPRQSVHIVDAVRELMRVVRAFESLSPLPCRNDEPKELSVTERAQAILTFIEELRLIAQFAQTVLDEEIDATATAVAAVDSSHASSSSSLLSLRGMLTRTPTPASDLHIDNDTAAQSASTTSLGQSESGANESSSEDVVNYELVLSGDGLAPTDTDDQLRPSLCGALSESLLDISLVMNDHHRILSEAAHWVGKARSMSPRNKRRQFGSPDGPNTSLDFTAELSQLVRDHCVVLSLSRKLFHLQDPRQDLSSVLECLAVLSRLAGRLGFFDLSIRTSDSNESLPTHTGTESRKNSEPFRQHENLRVSLSVFASMEQIARHLQDYDGFLGRMMQSHLGRDASVIENIETLTGAIEEQLAVVEQLRGLLGSTTAVKELPSLVEFLQRLVAKSTVDEEERGDDQDSCSLSVATMLKTVEEAFQDRVSLRGLLVQLRETLPFSSSVETPEELMEQLRETLFQCDTLIQDKENAWKMVEQLTEQLGQIDKRLADESYVLNGLGDEDIADLPHVERLARLVEQLKILRRANGMMTASIAAETELLRDVRSQADASSCSELIQLDARVEAVHALLEARATLTQEKEALECELQKTRSDFETKLRDAESDYEAKLHVATSNFEMTVHRTTSDFETKLHDTESDYKTKLQDATSDIETRLQQTKSDFETKLRDTTSDFETKLHDATSEGETKLRDAESAFEAQLRDTETAYGTKLRDMEITYEAKLRDTETVCETRLRDTESAYEIKVHDKETTYETKLSDTETAYATKLRDTETACETKLRDTEAAYETKLRDTETAYETQLRDTETAYENKLRDAEDAYETKTRDTATAFATELSETETQWKARHEDATSQLAAEREKLEDAIREETRFLRDRGIEWGEHESRVSIYDRLITKCDGYSIQEQRVREQVLEEAAFLESHGMEMVTAGDQETHSSRMVLFRTLLEGQRVLIDEKMEREITDQQERARLEADGIAVSDHGAIITRVIDLTKQVRQLEHDNAAQRKQRDEVCAMECAFLEAHGFPNVDLSPSDTRIPLFESLLERLEAAQQALSAWEGSPHEGALGCRQADTKHEADRQKLEQDYADATSKAIVAALDKQAKQLSFRSAALAAGDAALPLLTMAPSNSTTQALIEAVTKRDNAAVTMIYRLIRLTTDVLNTSAFSSSGSGGGGEIPVDLTQCVMTCVKELKALKEYLLHTLEKITQDSRAFAIAQPRLAITREAVTQRDAAIDFAWLLHRAFVADVHSTLAEKCAIVTSTIHSLSESLATHTGDFGEAEHKYMAMEMQLAEDVAEKAAIEAKYATQEAFVERFVDERKQVEAALTKALEEATQDRTELLAKIEMLEAEKSEAFALVYANGINTTGSHSASSSTLRTPLSSSHGRTVSHAGVVPTRPTKPRELTSSRLKIGMPSTSTAAGAVHKERFVSDLERETGQRRTTAAASSPHAGMTARRANEWKRHELLTSSMQIEEQFRAMTASSTDYLSLSSSESPRERSTAAGDQEVWYQGVRMLQHVSFFVSVFFVPRQKTFRVEVFNSDSEQQQTIYVTLEEMQSFLRENKHATKNGLTLEDSTRHGEVVDVLFERVKVLGGGVGGDSSNLLFAFQ